MNESFLNYPESNPFSTRFTAPGKTPFFFERSFLQRLKASHPAKFEDFFLRALGAGEDIRSSVCLQFLVDKFESNSRRGQIVGAHGSGKSSLMCVLKDSLSKRGYDIFQWTSRDQNHLLPDAFWIELQRFLQVPPSFLPVKCLLPPPVISREEYLRQQRESLRDVFDDFSEKSNETTPVEFNVSEAKLPSETVEIRQSSSEETETSVGENSTRNVAASFLERGGFLDLNAMEKRLDEEGASGDSEKLNLASDVSKPIKFAPFPGVAPPNETVVPASDFEEVDEVELVEEETDSREISGTMSGVAETSASSKAVIPLPIDYDFHKSRSFFEKKVVFFDGFEQLSYANRIIVRTFCRMNGLGLLLTTHSPAIGIPILFRTNPSVEILRQLLLFLSEDSDMMVPDDSELEILLKNFHYDVREILFSLYDAVENYRWAPREIREKIVRKYPR